MKNLLQKIITFDCQLVHIIGSENLIADYLSRHLIDDPNVEQPEEIRPDCQKIKSHSQTQKNHNKNNDVGADYLPQSADVSSASSTYKSKQTADSTTESKRKQTNVNNYVTKKLSHSSAIKPKFIKKNFQDPTIPSSI